MLLTSRRIAGLSPYAFRDPEFARNTWRIRMHTMCTASHLHTLVRCARIVAEEAIDGEIVECGTWRGGSAALLAWAGRRVTWACDSFAGMPKPSAVDGEQANRQWFPGWLATSAESVNEASARLALDPDCVRVLDGDFVQTLPGPIGTIALLHIDCDWYESVACVLDRLGPRLGSGAIVVVDDYNPTALTKWSGCRLAVDDWRKEIGLSTEIHLGKNDAWFRI